MKSLILITSKDYNDTILPQIKEISSKHNKVCYVTLNKTYGALNNLLEKQKINADKFYFIDFITPKVFKINRSEKCVFLDSLDLNEFADKVLNTIKLKKIDVLVFDSLSSFLIYRSQDDLLNFSDYVISFLEEMGVDIILFALDEDSDNSAIKQIKMRVDKTIKK